MDESRSQDFDAAVFLDRDEGVAAAFQTPCRTKRRTSSPQYWQLSSGREPGSSCASVSDGAEKPESLRSEARLAFEIKRSIPKATELGIEATAASNAPHLSEKKFYL